MLDQHLATKLQQRNTDGVQVTNLNKLFSQIISYMLSNLGSFQTLLYRNRGRTRVALRRDATATALQICEH